MTDRFAAFDAAYVLGALSPRERQEYEEHLHECPDCARAVRELAGIPGLLVKVQDDLVTSVVEREPRASLPPALLARARRERRRSKRTAFATIALAAAACVALVITLVFALRPAPVAAPAAAPAVTMSSGHAAPVDATVKLHEATWGTTLDIHCWYTRWSTSTAHTYTLVVLDGGGQTQHLGSWRLAPGEGVRLRAGTSWPLREISGVQIRTLSGRTVLQLKP